MKMANSLENGLRWHCHALKVECTAVPCTAAVPVSCTSPSHNENSRRAMNRSPEICQESDEK